MPYIELIQDNNTTNKLPSRFKGYADMNPQLLFEHDHQIILDLKLKLKVIVYFYSSVCLLYQHQGRTCVPCIPLVFPGQAQWAPCCLYTSLVVAYVPSAALESLFLF